MVPADTAHSQGCAPPRLRCAAAPHRGSENGMLQESLLCEPRRSFLLPIHSPRHIQQGFGFGHHSQGRPVEHTYPLEEPKLGQVILHIPPCAIGVHIGGSWARGECRTQHCVYHEARTRDSARCAYGTANSFPDLFCLGLRARRPASATTPGDRIRAGCVIWRATQRCSHRRRWAVDCGGFNGSPLYLNRDSSCVGRRFRVHQRGGRPCVPAYGQAWNPTAEKVGLPR